MNWPSKYEVEFDERHVWDEAMSMPPRWGLNSKAFASLGVAQARSDAALD
jgi:hypothetical protein